LRHVITVNSAAQPHYVYSFADRRTTRMKVLVFDGVGIRLPGGGSTRLARQRRSGTLLLSATLDRKHLSRKNTAAKPLFCTLVAHARHGKAEVAGDCSAAHAVNNQDGLFR
jgi:hypothetical protein